MTLSRPVGKESRLSSGKKSQKTSLLFMRHLWKLPDSFSLLSIFDFGSEDLVRRPARGCL